MKAVIKVGVGLVLAGLILVVLTGCDYTTEDPGEWILLREYAIGETGPAGGIIFYDKGNRFDGWRYLEAAPADIATGVIWNGDVATSVSTVWEVGNGEYNTRQIIETLGEDLGTAAEMCWNHSANGYDDWFLPSRDEAQEMFNNQAAIGGFTPAVHYWTSSENGINVVVTFLDGGLSNQARGSNGYVRPIRAF